MNMLPRTETSAWGEHAARGDERVEVGCAVQRLAGDGRERLCLNVGGSQ